MRSRRRTALLAAAAAAALVAGCGSEDFENNPRPPAPVELTAKVDDRRVVVSPDTIDGEPVGAGIANVTIANLTDDAVELAFTGPSDADTAPIVAGGVLDFKLALQEGMYRVEAEGSEIRPFELEIGPERPTSQNELLLP